MELLTRLWCPCYGDEASPSSGMHGFASIYPTQLDAPAKDEERCYATWCNRVKHTSLSFVIKDNPCFKVLHCLMSYIKTNHCSAFLLQSYTVQKSLVCNRPGPDQRTSAPKPPGPAWSASSNCTAPPHRHRMVPGAGVTELTFIFCTNTPRASPRIPKHPGNTQPKAAHGLRAAGPCTHSPRAAHGQDAPLPSSSGSFWSSPERDSSWSRAAFSPRCVLGQTRALCIAGRTRCGAGQGIGSQLRFWEQPRPAGTPAAGSLYCRASPWQQGREPAAAPWSPQQLFIEGHSHRGILPSAPPGPVRPPGASRCSQRRLQPWGCASCPPHA